MTPVELSSGLDPALEYPVLDPTVDPTPGENHAFWIFADDGRLAILNCHIQAGGRAGPRHAGPEGEFAGEPADWKRRRGVFTISLPDQRLLVDWAVGYETNEFGPAAAGWMFQCEAPFVRWTGRYRGSPRVTSLADQLAGPVPLDGPRVDAECDVTMDMAVPVWNRGDFAEPLAGSAEALRLMGVPKYEQLYRVTGDLRVANEKHRFTGTGLRTRRCGPRDLTAMCGHSWQSALFPNGRAFGAIRYPTRDGSTLYTEAFVTGSKGLNGARILKSPALNRLAGAGERFTVELETRDGSELISGETLTASIGMGLGRKSDQGAWVLYHQMARYEWDGESACGLLERSAMAEDLA